MATSRRNLVQKGFELLAWGAKHALGIPPGDVNETLKRLSWGVRKQPRYTPGFFRFPFGKLSYLDGPSLWSQYLDIFVRGVYEFQTEHEAPLILDCGGNIGLSVIWFKKRYPKSRVTVFEADPVIHEVLRNNLTGLGYHDVKVVPAAAWIRTGKVNFMRDGADCGRMDRIGGEQIVDAIRLADFITQTVDLLKLDIEGGEYAVLQDLFDTGEMGYVKRFICEIHGRHGEKRELSALLKALEEHDYRFTFTAARCAPDLPGKPEPTPFAAAGDGKFLLQLYAWQDGLGDD